MKEVARVQPKPNNLEHIQSVMDRMVNTLEKSWAVAEKLDKKKLK